MEGKITKIFNAADQIQAEMIHDHLKQNGIETMSKQPGTGEYMSIAMGILFMERIFMLEKIRKLRQKL